MSTATRRSWRIPAPGSVDQRNPTSKRAQVAHAWRTMRSEGAVQYLRELFDGGDVVATWTFPAPGETATGAVCGECWLAFDAEGEQTYRTFNAWKDAGYHVCRRATSPSAGQGFDALFCAHQVEKAERCTQPKFTADEKAARRARKEGRKQ